MPEFRIVQLSDVKLRVACEGEGPLVLFVHGFPESWYSWRHQMGPVAAAGYTACAVDVRGYGGSDKPYAVEAYTLQALSTDIAELIKALSPNAPAVVVGHDWGAPISWVTALIYPDLVRAVAGLSVPFIGIPRRSTTRLIEDMYTSKGRFFYQHYFAQEGSAEAEFEADVRSALRRFYYAWSGDAPDGTWPTNKKVGDTVLHRLPDPGKFPGWLTSADIDFYVDEFTRSGFRGGLNRYRNHDRDFAFYQDHKDKRILQPALYIAGERDYVLTMFGNRLDLLKTALPDLRGMDILPGCGHWTQQERPAEVNQRLLTWLACL